MECMGWDHSSAAKLFNLSSAKSVENGWKALLSALPRKLRNDLMGRILQNFLRQMCMIYVTFRCFFEVI